MNKLPSNIETIIDEFQTWYNADPHKDSEKSYAGQIGESGIKALDKKRLVEFFFKFAKEGGKIQSGGHRTASLLRETIQKNPEAFRKHAIAPFASAFDVAAWLKQSKSFKGWGQGIATIYLNRVDPMRFVVVNGKSIAAYRNLGYKVRASPLVSTYLDLESAQKDLLSQCPKMKNLFRADALSEFLEGKPQGKRLLNTSNEVNYWIFQGNPAYYDTLGALRAGVVKSWGIGAHKDKVKQGDKVILWLTGASGGCHALATVTSPLTQDPPPDTDRHFFVGSGDNLPKERVSIHIDHNLVEKPVTWEEIKNLPCMSDFKGRNRGTTFQATKEQYEAILESAKRMSGKIISRHTTPLNIIHYGPPGTGKTYSLRERYFERYTTRVAALTQRQRLTELVKGMSWWEVVAMVLLDIGPAKTGDIMGHELLEIKTGLSNSANIRATVWGALQTHTVTECKLVNYSLRQEPLIFSKREGSVWEVLGGQDDEFTSDLRNKLERSRKQDMTGDVVNRYDFVTFHQSFSYEDFIEGIKPVMGSGAISYDVIPGIFRQICARAEQDPTNDYALFIDEINRGNVSAIFGELISLIEADKRSGMPNALTAILPYSKMSFSVPPNLDIIATMNTADRSVEALDTALRRRFTFEEFPSRPEALLNRKVGSVDLTELLRVINARIEMLLDRDHQIGHSYFMNWEPLVDPELKLRSVFKNNIIPLLQEYFYGDPVKVALVLGPTFVTEVDGAKVRFAKDVPGGEDVDAKPRFVFRDPLEKQGDSFVIPLSAFETICTGA